MIRITILLPRSLRAFKSNLINCDDETIQKNKDSRAMWQHRLFGAGHCMTPSIDSGLGALK